MSVRIDPADRSLVAWCSECPSWRELRGTYAAALTAAADHVHRVHDDQDRAKALRQGATRASDT